MLAVGHELTDGRESFEVQPFRGQQRIGLEVRDDTPDELIELACFPLQRLVAAVRPDASASEVSLQRVEHLGAVSVLADGEARPHLPSHLERRPRCDGNGEAAFAVGVAGDVRREELATGQRAGV